MKNKFYEIKNFIPKKSADLYIYGQIVTDDIDWWTGEKDENLVGLQSFKKELDELGEIQDLNIYLNTPGGEVFVATTMCSMLQRLKDKGIIQSMSRKGNCLDNSVMENFFGLLKSEMFYHHKFESTDELIVAIKEYIDYYNNERIKEKLKGLSPVQYRTKSIEVA